MSAASEARVATTVPRRYLGQLCKHFEHRLPVTADDTHGRIEFPAGTCELQALPEQATLVLRVSAALESDLPGLEDVVGRHLQRFAFREDLDICWDRGT